MSMLTLHEQRKIKQLKGTVASLLDILEDIIHDSDKLSEDQSQRAATAIELARKSGRS